MPQRWESDPIVGESPRWASDPVVSMAEPRQKKAPTFGSRLYETTVGPMVDLVGAVKDRAAKQKGSPLAALGEVGFETLTGAAKGMYDRYANSPQTRSGNPMGGVIDAVVRPIVEPVYEDVQAGNYGAAAGGLAGNTLMMFGPEVALGTAAKGTGLARRIQTAALKPPQKWDTARVARAVDESLDQGVTATNVKKASALKTKAARAVEERVALNEAAGRTIDPNVAAEQIGAVERAAAMQSDPAREVTIVSAKRDRILSEAGARPATPPQASPLVDQFGRPIVIPGRPAQPAPPMSFAEAQARKQGDYQVNARAYERTPDQVPVRESEALAAYDRGIRQQQEMLDPLLGPMNQTTGARLDLEKLVRRVSRTEENKGGFGLTDVVAALSGGSVGGMAGGVEQAVVGGLSAYAARKILANPAVRSRIAITIFRNAQRSGAAIPMAQATARANALINSLMPKEEEEETQ